MLYCVSEACLSFHCKCGGFLRLAVFFSPLHAAFRLIAVAPAGARRLIFRVGVNLGPMEDIVIWCLKQVLACCGKQYKQLTVMESISGESLSVYVLLVIRIIVYSPAIREKKTILFRKALKGLAGWSKAYSQGVC